MTWQEDVLELLTVANDGDSMSGAWCDAFEALDLARKYIEVVPGILGTGLRPDVEPLERLVSDD